jgi:hypothetical protein
MRRRFRQPGKRDARDRDEEAVRGFEAEKKNIVVAGGKE